MEGAQRLDTGVVRDLLFARPGRPFSEADLIQSQRNLYKTDLVRSVSVDVDSANWQPGADSVPLLVQLSESRPYRIRAGLGYATTECFRTSAQWTARNFLGEARTLELNGQLSRIGVGDPLDFGFADNICSVTREDSIGSSKVNYRLGATVRRPAFLGPPNTLALTLFAERRSEFKVYRRQEVGASVEIQRESPRARLPVSLSYTLSYGETEATPVSFCAFFNACTPDVIDQLRQRRLLAALAAKVSIPRANSPVDPTRGYNASLEVTYASKLIGSSAFQQFTRVFAEAAWYRPLSRDVVLSWRIRGGLIFSPEVAVGAELNSFVPPEQRFYAGGPNDVRGFNRNELGPVVYVVTDSALRSVGGNPDNLAGRFGAGRADRRQHAAGGERRAARAVADLSGAAPLRGLPRRGHAAGSADVTMTSAGRASGSRPGSASGSARRSGPRASIWPTTATIRRRVRSSRPTPPATCSRSGTTSRSTAGAGFSARRSRSSSRSGSRSDAAADRAVRLRHAAGGHRHGRGRRDGAHAVAAGARPAGAHRLQRAQPGDQRLGGHRLDLRLLRVRPDARASRRAGYRRACSWRTCRASASRTRFPTSSPAASCSAGCTWISR